jgi:hypothetical protein
MDLRDNPLITQRSAPLLLEAVRTNKRLHTIALEGTGLSASACAEIRQGCDKNAMWLAQQVLRSGDAGMASLHFLRGRCITDSFVKDVTKFLVRNAFVTYIDLANNPSVTDNVVRAFEAALLQEACVSVLKEVCLDGTAVSPAAKRELCELLEGRNLRRCALCINNVYAWIMCVCVCVCVCMCVCVCVCVRVCS